ncbi:BspA family leucine-rich repeat surface protein [Enterococcus hirae]|uniref:BspA family leucine-rich repeat surface protein n=1 Tax=Enterococcus hirae TaxID=1354 RepID=UPI001377C09B|nr:BspA family leucine-rich repeat surface protein [Enterococcus hirae]NBA40627.1 BspA family leucine-rich repeat surface protein [Enterococcus hirae]NBA56621.1 BspA family leucine-rich repeat surface protein [Enterococcus hirae]
MSKKLAISMSLLLSLIQILPTVVVKSDTDVDNITTSTNSMQTQLVEVPPVTETKTSNSAMDDSSLEENKSMLKDDYYSYSYLSEYFEVDYITQTTKNYYLIKSIKKDKDGKIMIPTIVRDDSDNETVVQYSQTFWDSIKNYAGAASIKKFEILNRSPIFWVANGYRQVDLSHLFENYSSLETVDMSNMAWISVQNMSSMFQNCIQLKTVKLGIDTSNPNRDLSTVTDTTNMFLNCSSLQSISGLENVNFLNLKSAYGMFDNCKSLKNIDNNQINWGNTESLEDISQIFNNCSSLETLDFININTASVKNMIRVFQNCNNLKNITGLSKWNVERVEDTTAMFNNCYNLQNLDLSEWHTNNLVTLTYMFNHCINLQSINVSNWDTSKVITMKQLFQNCSSLNSIIGLETWKTSQVSNMDNMFAYTDKLTYLDLSKFDMSKVVSNENMFLVDGQKYLLLTAVDDKLLHYNYSTDNCLPGGPIFDADGGYFNIGENVKYYFDSCAVIPTDSRLQLAVFNQFKNSLTPTKEKFMFRQWDLVEGSEPTTNKDLFNSIKYRAKWSMLLMNNHIPSENIDNTKIQSSSAYGISYIPSRFTIPTTFLNNQDTQEIPINTHTGYHVAVQDQRNLQSGWTLQAILVWDQKELSGSYIKTTNSSGIVKRNINDGTTDFKDSDLVNISGEVIGKTNAIITTDALNEIMSAEKLNHDAVYDYDLGDVSLVLEDVSNIPPGSYTGGINWNLVDSP